MLQTDDLSILKTGCQPLVPIGGTELNRDYSRLELKTPYEVNKNRFSEQESLDFSSHVLVKQRIYERLRIELDQIILLLADSNVTHRNSQLVCDRDHNAALRRSIKLGKHDACNAR